MPNGSHKLIRAESNLVCNYQVNIKTENNANNDRKEKQEIKDR